MKQLLHKIVYRIRMTWAALTGTKWWYVDCCVEADPLSGQTENDSVLVRAKTREDAIHKAMEMVARNWMVQEEHVYVFDINETTSPVLIGGE